MHFQINSILQQIQTIKTPSVSKCPLKWAAFKPMHSAYNLATGYNKDHKAVSKECLKSILW